jgi:DNA-binding FadR family transcriptional regulator
MTPLDLLADLEAMGFQVEADGERLFIRPREKVTPDLVERIKTHKAALLDLLETRRFIRGQIAALIPYKTPDGRRGWVNPRHRAELERNGLL